MVTSYKDNIILHICILGVGALILTVSGDTSDAFAKISGQGVMQNRIFINKTEYLGSFYEVFRPRCQKVAILILILHFPKKPIPLHS